MHFCWNSRFFFTSIFSLFCIFQIKYLCEAINFLFLCCSALFMYFIACACTDTNEHTNKTENTTYQFRTSVHKAIKNRIAVARYCWAHTFTICNGRNVWQCRQHKIDYWLNINNLRVFVASLLLFRFHCKISSAHPANGRLWSDSNTRTTTISPKDLCIFMLGDWMIGCFW